MQVFYIEDGNNEFLGNVGAPFAKCCHIEVNMYGGKEVQTPHMKITGSLCQCWIIYSNTCDSCLEVRFDIKKGNSKMPMGLVRKVCPGC